MVAASDQVIVVNIANLQEGQFNGKISAKGCLGGVTCKLPASGDTRNLRGPKYDFVCILGGKL